MIAGRVAAVVHGRKTGLKFDPFRKSETQQMLEIAQGSSSHEDIEGLDVNECLAKKLRFRKLPWLMWTIAVVLMASFCFIEWNILFEQGDDYRPHTWEQIGLNLILLAISLWFVCDAKVETVVFDKVTQTVLLTNTQANCKKKYTCHSLK